MPVWHETLKPLLDAGDVVMLGVIQEQHPQRCRLFAQWKGFDWPILHDPINRLGPTAVPIFVAIDEHGVVRSVGPDEEWVTQEFLTTDYEAPPKAAAGKSRGEPDAEALLQSAEAINTADAWTAAGDAVVLWQPQQIDRAIAAYARAAELDPQSAPIRFRLGVACKIRSESDAGGAYDFQQAIDHWSAALEIDPNHYIYRRRIQQYGPRLIKPYPFYDWVAQAREEIASRGETPIALPVEPSGAEIAQPQRQFAGAIERGEAPDPGGRIRRDQEGLIDISAVVAPSAIEPGDAARVHLELEPTRGAHWNNEVEPVVVWIDGADGWTLDAHLHTLPQPPEPESREQRRLEFEVHAPRSANGPQTLRGYALYYVCEEAGGRCLYRRQDFAVTINVAEAD